MLSYYFFKKTYVSRQSFPWLQERKKNVFLSFSWENVGEQAFSVCIFWWQRIYFPKQCSMVIWIWRWSTHIYPLPHPIIYILTTLEVLKLELIMDFKIIFEECQPSSPKRTLEHSPLGKWELPIFQSGLKSELY